MIGGEILGGSGVGVDPTESIDFSVGVFPELLFFLLFSFSCLAFCRCLALRFLNHT